MRALLLSSLALGVVATVAATGTADAQETRAQTFGVRGAAVITLDDFVGVFRETVYSPDYGSEQGGVFFGTHTGAYSYAETARLGVHVFAAPWLSFGTGLHASFHESADRPPLAGKVLGVSPRIGFVAAWSTTSAVWIRVGAQYQHHDYGNAGTAWSFGPGVEVFYVYTPYSHFGVTFGPVVELDVAGKIEGKGSIVTPGTVTSFGDVEAAYRRRMFGLALGFLFDF